MSDSFGAWKNHDLYDLGGKYFWSLPLPEPPPERYTIPSYGDTPERVFELRPDDYYTTGDYHEVQTVGVA